MLSDTNHLVARTRYLSGKFVAAAALASVAAAALLAACTAPAPAASLSRSVDVDATPDEVWSLIGPFCAIKDWLPPVGSCSEDGNTPPTRTLVTRDGKATFVERQIARDDAQHLYSYTFVSSPLPVSGYKSTLFVTPTRDGGATITWSGAYTPAPGQEKAALDALNGIYEAGLGTIKAEVEK